MDTATTLRIRFVPLLKKVNSENIQTKCCIEIVPKLSRLQNLDKINWSTNGSLIEYNIPITYKIVIKKQDDLSKDVSGKTYHSCVDLLPAYSQPDLGSGEIKQVTSDNMITLHLMKSSKEVHGTLLIPFEDKCLADTTSNKELQEIKLNQNDINKEMEEEFNVKKVQSTVNLTNLQNAVNLKTLDKHEKPKSPNTIVLYSTDESLTSISECLGVLHEDALYCNGKPALSPMRTVTCNNLLSNTNSYKTQASQCNSLYQLKRHRNKKHVANRSHKPNKQICREFETQTNKMQKTETICSTDDSLSTSNNSNEFESPPIILKEIANNRNQYEKPVKLAKKYRNKYDKPINQTPNIKITAKDKTTSTSQILNFGKTDLENEFLNTRQYISSSQKNASTKTNVNDLASKSLDFRNKCQNVSSQDCETGSNYKNKSFNDVILHTKEILNNIIKDDFYKTELRNIFHTNELNMESLNFSDEIAKCNNMKTPLTDMKEIRIPAREYINTSNMEKPFNVWAEIGDHNIHRSFNACTEKINHIQDDSTIENSIANRTSPRARAAILIKTLQDEINPLKKMLCEIKYKCSVLGLRGGCNGEFKLFTKNPFFDPMFDYETEQSLPDTNESNRMVYSFFCDCKTS